MALIHPFRALRYDPAHVPDVGPVMAPPYDVIQAREQERLYAASPYNIVRLILGKVFPGDDEQENRYTRARREFEAWRAQGVLRRDPEPALYLMEHRWEEAAHEHVRLGFLALLDLQEALERQVLRHEATLAAPREDRAKLLEAVPANLSPVFCVYPDAGGGVSSTLQGLARRMTPAVEASWQEERLRLWVVTDPAIVERIRRGVAEAAVLIADGHHRFEVAYAQRHRAGALMAYFVSMQDPGLRVRPIHRVVEAGGRVSGEAVRDGPCVMEATGDLASLMQWLSQGTAGGEGRFGYVTGRTLFRVAVKDDRRSRWLERSGVPRPLAELDVSLLHGLVLPALGVNGADVHYTPDAEEAVTSVAAGQGRSAWLLRPLPLEQVYAVAAQGHLLPPKTTYFYPKVPSGLAIYPFD